MSSNLLASDVIIQEEKPVVRAIIAAATAVLGLIGIAERGPVAQATLSTSFDQWERTYGGPTVNNQDTYLAVQGYYAEGGSALWFVRTVHFGTTTDPTTKTSDVATANLPTAAIAATGGYVLGSNTGPWALVTGDTLVITTDATSGTATFTAAAASRESGAGTFNIPNNATLTVSIDGGSVQTIVFPSTAFVDNTAATAAEVAAVINGQIVGANATVTSSTHVTITSDTKGTASGVNVTGGTANGGILAFTTGNVAGTGNVANIAAVTFTEAKTRIEAANAGVTATNVGGAVKITRNTTGTGATVQVEASSSADDEFGFDNAVHAGTAGGTLDTLQVDAKDDGTYGNGISLTVASPTNGTAGYFNLKVIRGGVTVEVWPNVNLDSTSGDYAPTVVNDANVGSVYVKLTDLAAAVSFPDNAPAAGTYGPLDGGDDGLASLGDQDFIGGSGANGKVGIRCLDAVQDVTLLCVPQRATAAVHAAEITYCEVTRNGSVFAVLDPPASQSTSGIVSYWKTNGLKGLSEYCAIYWPRIKVDNPSTAIYGNTTLLVAPPSGAICGVYARVDASQPSGVFQHPAGTENGRLFSARGLESDEVKEKANREIVFPELINPISVEPGTPIFLDGARCGKSDGSFPTIGERRGVIFVETSLKTGLAFMRHRNINPKLYAEGERTTRAFLLQQTRNEAFSTTDPALAFTVDFGPGLNTASTKFARQVIARVGLATAKPAEFIIVKVSPDLRDLLAELAAAA